MIKFSYRKCFCGLVLFLICIFLSAQDVPSVTDESKIYLDGSVSNVEAPEKETSSNIWPVLRVVLVLVAVCGGIYGVVYLLKKSTKISVGNDPYIKNVASLTLAPGRSVQIITVGPQAFLIGVTERSISLIAELTDQELIDAMNLSADKKNPVPAGSFASLLGKFIPGQSKAERSFMNDSPASSVTGADFLRRQRERFQGDSTSTDKQAGSDTTT